MIVKYRKQKRYSIKLNLKIKNYKWLNGNEKHDRSIIYSIRFEYNNKFRWNYFDNIYNYSLVYTVYTGRLLTIENFLRY